VFDRLIHDRWNITVSLSMYHHAVGLFCVHSTIIVVSSIQYCGNGALGVIRVIKDQQRRKGRERKWKEETKAQSSSWLNYNIVPG